MLTKRKNTYYSLLKYVQTQLITASINNELVLHFFDTAVLKKNYLLVIQYTFADRQN